ncbi:MAG: hypothetical protein CM15mP92_1970 [Halieaceae bacterium]|nr:MAG: hypothetical protein CM15mP92_1970 [Halieaceae bacterium]
MSSGDPGARRRRSTGKLKSGLSTPTKDPAHLLLLRDEAASDAQQFGQPFQWLYETHHGQAVYGTQ